MILHLPKTYQYIIVLIRIWHIEHCLAFANTLYLLLLFRPLVCMERPENQIYRPTNEPPQQTRTRTKDIAGQSPNARQACEQHHSVNGTLLKVTD